MPCGSLGTDGRAATASADLRGLNPQPVAEKMENPPNVHSRVLKTRRSGWWQVSLQEGEDCFRSSQTRDPFPLVFIFRVGMLHLVSPEKGKLRTVSLSRWLPGSHILSFQTPGTLTQDWRLRKSVLERTDCFPDGHTGTFVADFSHPPACGFFVCVHVVHVSLCVCV